MNLKVATALILCILIPLSCLSPPENHADIQGTWFSNGYGQILEVKTTHFRFFDQYPGICIPRHEGKLWHIAPAFQIIKDTLIYSKGTSAYRFIRIDKDTLFCRTNNESKPQKDVILNFDAFAETVLHRYAFQSALPISLDRLITDEYQKLKENPTETQLYHSLENILALMNDNHGYLEPTEEFFRVHELTDVTSQDTKQNTSEEVEEIGDFQVANKVADTYFEKEYTRESAILRWGLINDSTGYIQVKAMWLYADLHPDKKYIEALGFVGAYVREKEKLAESTYIELERQGASHLMDLVMNDLKTTSSLIIDVRFNGGGQDVVSQEILRRFNPQILPVATKKAYVNGAYTDEQTLYLPASGNAYLQPVYVLTSRQTASAADFIAMASLALPHFTRVGQNTQGALSDALEKRLPNGWYFSLSNELYYDMNGNHYEYLGVPPDVRIDYPEDRQHFFQKIMENPAEDKNEVLKLIKEHYKQQNKEDQEQ